MATLLNSATFISRKADGTPNALGRVYTYAAGTLTPLASYTTQAGNVANTNPVVLGADGCAQVWLDSSLTYRIIEKTSADVTIRDTDNITASGLADLASTASGKGSALVGYLPAGTGASTSLTVQDKLRESLSVKDFGAVGNGAVNDAPAVQLCVAAALASGRAIYFPSGAYLFASTVEINARWVIHGDGNNSIIVVTDPTIAAFTFNINATSVNMPEITGLRFIGPVTTNPLSTALRFIGDSTAFVQHGRFTFSCVNFNSIVKDEKAPRTTVSGLEGMLNWNKWNITVLNAGSAAFWGTQGSGTGNEWDLNGLTVNAGAAMLKFEGVSCVVGDIIARGHWGCQVPGGVGLEIGAATAYREQIKIGDAQFDANLDVPLKFGTGGTRYSNLNISDNNLGGNAALGNAMQPVYSSVVVDREYSEWQAGRTKSSNATVLTTTSCFEVLFATVGAASLRITAAGVVGGVGSCIAVSEFDIREALGALTLTGPFNNREDGGTGRLSISVTVSGVIATVKVSHTASVAGTLYNVSLSATGDGFKVTRL